VDATALRSQFPVLDERAYLNSGTCGPLPRRALHAVADVLGRAAVEGRTRSYMETMISFRGRQRAAYAERLGADPADVALTTCTSEGVVRVLAGLSLGPGDEVLTAPDEHPGLLGPLSSLRARRGVSIRTVPFSELADAVGRRTRLVACSHVNWVTGAVRPDGLAELGPNVPVLLDGAQGVGAVPIDVTALGCAFYAGSGQ
jgi:selenocysteine lyase/cysteine desulfurase